MIWDILFYILIIFSFIVLSLFIQLRDFEDNDIPYGRFIIFCIVNFFLLNNRQYMYPVLSYYIFTLFYFVALIGILAIILSSCNLIKKLKVIKTFININLKMLDFHRKSS